MNTEEELQEIKKRICSILGVSESYTYEEIEHALKAFKHADEQYTELANDLCNSKQDYANLKLQFDSLIQQGICYEEPLPEAAKDEKANYFVYNARRDVPNKVYKSKQEALKDAKQLAYKEVNPIFVLKLESLIIPHCELNIHDISETGIPDKYLNQYQTVESILSENEIPF